MQNYSTWPTIKNIERKTKEKKREKKEKRGRKKPMGKKLGV